MNTPRRLVWLACATAVILGLGALLLFLPRLVELLLIAGLEQADFPNPGLQVTEVGWHQTTIADLRLGADGEFGVEQATVTYSPIDLLHRQIDDIRLYGLRLTLRLDGKGPPLGSLEAPLSALRSGTANDTGATLPEIRLEESRIAAMTRLGTLVIPLDGTVTTETDGAIRGRFTIPTGAVDLPEVTARALSGTVQFAMTPERLVSLSARLDLAGLALSAATVETAALAIDLAGNSGSARLRVAEGDDALDLRAEASVDDLYGSPDLSAEVEATATAASGVWQLVGMPPPVERQASLSGSISGRLSSAKDRDSFAGSAKISIAADDATLDGTMTDTAVTGAPDSFAGTAQIALAASGFETLPIRAAEVALAADTAFAFADGILTLQPRGSDGLVTARQLVAPGILETTGPLRLPLRPADEPMLSLDLAAADGLRLDHALTVGPIHLTVRLQPDSAAPLPADLKLEALTASGSWNGPSGYRGTAALTGGELLLPDQQIAATGVEGDLAVGRADASSEAHLRIAQLTHGADSPLFAPLPVRANAVLNGDRLTFAIRATGAGERAVLTVEGRHDLRSGAGAADIDLPPVTFAPDGMTPTDLAPMLKGQVTQATGTVGLAGTLSWTADGTASDVQMLLRDLSFTTPLAEIVRLNSVVRFDSLLPLSTPPGQTLAIGLIDAVLPLSDGIGTFQLRRDGTLVVSDGRLRLAGGEIAVEPAVIDLNAPENRIQLTVTDVALSELLALADIEGLSATGRLDGRIPVRLGNDVIIQNGTLTADSPGRLSYSPASPPAALQAQGETVSLLLSALTNFEYHDLRLTVDREAGGEMLVAVHIAGKNPAFYDGYPVELNFNVSGKLDQVLQRSLVGYRIPDAIRDKLSNFPQ